ncbi:hypothetical protein SEA_GODPHATHER_74 [Mycobacterium phage GodPhather]|uniref:Uncharacterized protein n=1 Tax=Mycobacterium phage Jeon TaxID=2108123 RepID=A0A2P1JRQ8_9CAUD|nr:hypothetical protein PQB70_gp83 [Mycobacterium phage Jeon]AVO21772.1 hypothetical protein SEA_JEON_70 [Mycobacterium phage Jeon]QBP32646.1 hypothetical protein SEA_GODPHATHER_74 [Mycobacterium phage GodPhather]
MTTLTLAEGYQPLGCRSTTADLDRFTAQKPYRNGVVVYTDSGWLGNGFGNECTKIAVQNSQIVGVYETHGYYHRHASVVGISSISADQERGPNGDLYTTKTALSKWIEAVKALPAQAPAPRDYRMVVAVTDGAAGVQILDANGETILEEQNDLTVEEALAYLTRYVYRP